MALFIMLDRQGISEMEAALQVATIIGIGVAVIAQAITFIWFFSKLDSRVATNERLLAQIQDYPDRLARIETKLEFMSSQISKILENQRVRKESTQ